MTTIKYIALGLFAALAVGCGDSGSKKSTVNTNNGLYYWSGSYCMTNQYGTPQQVATSMCPTQGGAAGTSCVGYYVYPNNWYIYQCNGANCRGYYMMKCMDNTPSCTQLNQTPTLCQ